MRRKAAVFMGVCALASSSAQAKDLPRTASTSLCGDAYLLALAPDQAAALSWQSRDKVSRATPEQKTLPQVWDNPERLVGAGADHIIFGSGEGGLSRRFLKKADITSGSLIWGEDFESVKLNYAAIGRSISAVDVAAYKTDDLDKRLALLQSRSQLRAATPKILYMSRAGGTAGRSTFVDAAITAAGGVNVVESSGWITLDPENIMALKPDLIVTSFMNGGYESVNAKGLRHKVLREFMAARPQVNIPGALWPCAGPGLIEAAELIASGLDGLK